MLSEWLLELGCLEGIADIEACPPSMLDKLSRTSKLRIETSLFRSSGFDLALSNRLVRDRVESPADKGFCRELGSSSHAKLFRSKPNETGPILRTDLDLSIRDDSLIAPVVQGVWFSG